MSQPEADKASKMNSPLEITIIPVTAMEQNCLIIGAGPGEEQMGTIIDPGGSADKIIAEVTRRNLNIEQILLTHTHLDHVGAAAEISAHFSVPIRGPHRDDLPILEGLQPSPSFFGLGEVEMPKIDQWLDDGQKVTIAGHEFTAILCSGHTPGHLLYFASSLKIAFTGDLLFAGSIGRTDLPMGDERTLLRSIAEKMLPLGDDVTFYPGHGAISTIGEEKNVNPFLQNLPR